ncbi:hypothetical protein INT46_008238 [Mucor plumbeus]|uniref:Uncharacterized protein n=1 Tax=Mucor plumbeus TaxID=97098 RepID=A0A8H7R943_9FUNG|nr:hypothetical protein INT46_008238 [Mucor plumbeus]
MEPALNSFTNNNCHSQHSSILISSSISDSSGNSIVPTAHYIYGAGNYMTFNPELYYPNACLFCGLPNGSKKEATFTTTCTSQETIIATAAPTIQFYSDGTNEKPRNRLLEIIIHKHPKSKNLASIMSKLISNRFQTTLQKWRQYLIQKRLHFPVVTQSRKRFLIPSSFY